VGVRPRVRLGGLGVLDVTVDGRLVYSKKRDGAAMGDEAIVARVARRETGRCTTS
jgi:predicted Rdx family selenoprotein